MAWDGEGFRGGDWRVVCGWCGVCGFYLDAIFYIFFTFSFVFRTRELQSSF